MESLLKPLLIQVRKVRFYLMNMLKNVAWREFLIEDIDRLQLELVSKSLKAEFMLFLLKFQNNFFKSISCY
jgi:hypothetical protein